MERSPGSVLDNPHGVCLLCGDPACITVDISDGGKTIDVCVRHWQMWHHRLVGGTSDATIASELRVLLNE
jgi:hypothetical protein